MLLTLQPQQTGGANVNEYTVIHKIHPTPRSSWSDTSSGQDPQPMESSQRELPPSSTLNLPAAMPTPLPPPPSQWQGTESMQQWLLAKTEEDRRSQEEEKTRQETLRLEQRRIEQMILIESLRAGVPPPMVPLIFAAMHSSGAGNLQLMIDTAQQWMAQPSRSAMAPGAQQQQAYQSHSLSTTLPPIQSQQLPSQVAAGEPQRDPRTPASNVYTPQHPTMGIINTAPQPAGNGSSMSSAAGTPVPLPAHLPRPIEMQQPAMQTAHVGPVQYVAAPHVPQHAPMRQDPRPRRPSPSISFHHWVPPGQPSHAPASARSQPESIPADPAPSAMRHDSPSRKRKPQAAHTPIAPPARPSEFVPAEAQSGRQSPIIGTPQHAHGTPGITTAHESYHHEERPETRQRESPEMSPWARRGKSGRGFKREHHSRSPERSRKAQDHPSSRHKTTASDEENISDPSPDTGGST
ncbi:uncharacterized protein N7483_009739 [Penicillium malachiteum]|uniref:uncharacterized protein n=1 Tax=Penicillium malachiteum TaxID=1324776 RepID=UPI002548E5F8|nr:uncharacterized protein N7483_009739 [Penicillium malachiteum]KAJ5721805.1 hypothetical protein N7483_009739 [Penicillium malachiteum]